MNSESKTTPPHGDLGPDSVLVVAVIITLLVVATLALGERFCPHMRAPADSHAER